MLERTEIHLPQIQSSHIPPTTQSNERMTM